MIGWLFILCFLLIWPMVRRRFLSGVNRRPFWHQCRLSRRSFSTSSGAPGENNAARAPTQKKKGATPRQWRNLFFSPFLSHLSLHLYLFHMHESLSFLSVAFLNFLAFSPVASPSLFSFLLFFLFFFPSFFPLSRRQTFICDRRRRTSGWDSRISCWLGWWRRGWW